MDSDTKLQRVSLLFFVLLILSAIGQAQSSLTTTFLAGNSQRGNMFDVKSLTGVMIQGFDIHFDGVADIEIWALNSFGSFVGNETSNANWNLLATVPNVTGNGLGVATPLGLNLGFPIPPGQVQAFYITTTNGENLSYSNGSLQGSIFTSNADLEIHEGNGGAYFNVTFTPRVWNGTIHYVLFTALDFDFEMVEILTPKNDTLNCDPRPNSETVTVRVRSIGGLPVPAGTSFSLFFQEDGGSPVVETMTTTNTIIVGENVDLSFATPTNLSAVGNHTLTVGINWTMDEDPSNDVLSAMVNSGGKLRVTTLPYFEDFTVTGLNNTTVPPLGFSNIEVETTGPWADWIMRNNRTPIVQTGPIADHTTGIEHMGGFAYVDSRGNHLGVKLRSPCLDLTNTTSPRLQFYLHSNVLNSFEVDNLLSIDVIKYFPRQVTVDALGPLTGTGPNWERQELDLSAFAGEIIQLVFRVRNENSFLHDIAIDDLLVTDLVTPGSGEDLVLSSSINEAPSIFGNNPPAVSGDTLSLKIDSPQGTYNTLSPLLCAQPFLGSQAPARTPGYPELYLDFAPNVYFPVLTLYSAQSSPMPPQLLAPGGLSFDFTVPSGLSGFSLMIQGFVLAPSAIQSNPWFTATDAHLVQFQ